MKVELTACGKPSHHKLQGSSPAPRPWSRSCPRCAPLDIGFIRQWGKSWKYWNIVCFINAPWDIDVIKQRGKYLNYCNIEIQWRKSLEMLFDGVATFKSLFCFKILKSCFPPRWAGGCSTGLHDARPPCEVEKYFYFVSEKSFTDFAPCWTILVLGKILFLFLRALNLKTFNKQILTTPKRSNLSSCSKLIPACLRKGAESSRIQELASNFNGKGITDTRLSQPAACPH